jgi:hypothetical protein
MAATQQFNSDIQEEKFRYFSSQKKELRWGITAAQIFRI